VAIASSELNSIFSSVKSMGMSQENFIVWPSLPLAQPTYLGAGFAVALHGALSLPSPRASAGRYDYRQGRVGE
jgi:hypothetical protein